MAGPSLSEKACQQIRTWIIQYDLKPGSHLKVGEIAGALNMSQTPVREALSMLQQECLVERQAKSGYRVRAMNLQEVEDLYELRIALEVLAARQAAKRMGQAERDRLAAILAEVGGLLDTDDKRRILQLEQDYHVIIFEASGNRALAEMGRTILDRIWIIQNINLLTTDHLSQAHPQHVEVFEALRAGDPQKAANLMRRHVSGARDFVLSRLKNSDDVLTKIMLGFPFAARDGVPGP
jgi:DNA-binding GntR family transcriptional regulator